MSKELSTVVLKQPQVDVKWEKKHHYNVSSDDIKLQLQVHHGKVENVKFVKFSKEQDCKKIVETALEKIKTIQQERAVNKAAKKADKKAEQKHAKELKHASEKAKKEAHKAEKALNKTLKKAGK